MVFWGIEVKPGKSVIHSYEKARGRLRLSQATLGISDDTKKSILQCNIGERSPILLCVLLPNQIESCHLELEFEEADDVVFSVIGHRSVHLTGYYITQNEQSSPSSHTDSGFNGMDIKHTSHTPRSQLAHPGMTSDCFIASRSSWIVDSGATDHMTGNKSILSDLATTSQPPVQIANGSTCKIDGVGCTQLSPNMPLSSVLYVPSFPENLMSVSKITEQLNCSVTFTPTKCIFQELGTNRLIGTAYKEQGLYYMESSPQRVAYLSTRSAQEVHYQLGHPSLRHPGFSDSLRTDDANPRLVFHYGIPSASALLAYDSIQQILAISTKDGQIKLFGKDGSQALLESSEMLPSKFLLFIENQGILINVNARNQIEVWNLDKKCLSTVYHFEKEITSFVAMRNGAYLYIGDSFGNASVLRLHDEPCHIEPMKYHIPLSASYGKTNEIESDIAAKHVLPQPTAENKRLLIIYSDGIITLWGLRENKVISSNSGGTTMLKEAKKVTAACWACSNGTKIVVGYSNGDIIIWSVPCPADSNAELAPTQITPTFKLNLGYKAENIPIAKLNWVDADGKSSRLYVLGSSDSNSTNLLQVVLLNEHTETRTIKLGLHPPEALVDLEITTNSIDQNKQRRDSLILLGKSSHVYTYDIYSIERYLAQSQSKSSPSLPKEVMVKLPYCDSSITISKFATSIPCMPSSADEDLNMLAKNSLPLFPFERSVKEGSNSSFSKAKNLLITGHISGAINFWDASCPLLLPVVCITQQSEIDFTLSGIPVTALHFIHDTHILVSGDQSGTVRILTFKSEAFAPQGTFMSFQGSSKKGSGNTIRRIKVVKVNGAVLSITTTGNLKQLAIGSDQGYVSLIDPDGPTVLYERHIASEFCTGIISMHFETSTFHGFEKNVILVATKDSSVVALERDSGNTLSSGVVRPNKPAKALFTCVLGSSTCDALDVNTISSDNSTPKQSFLLLCTEKSVYAFSLLHLVQGVKKVVYKKKFSSPCYYASTFGSPDVGLILLFASGKIEIRSLPDLSLVKESSIIALTFSTFRPFSVSDIVVSSSVDGELVIVRNDQELLFISTLLQETYKFLNFVSTVLNKDLVNAQGLVCSPPVKEKKKGIFASVMKDNKSAKSKNGNDMETKDCRQSIEELSIIFSTANFPTDTETEENNFMNEENDNLDIDDINIDDYEDPKEKPRGGYPVIAGLNRQNITNKFQAIRGKLMHTKVKNEKNEEAVEEKSGGVDEIKKKYGYVESGGVGNVAKMKLGENLKKLQGISLKTTEMQDTARSFSSMAKEVLRFSENDKKG